jgi:three-Cys-motif partner protein
MCGFVATPDGLSEYTCGHWTIEKLYFLCHYLALFTHTMVGNPKFRAVNYVDLFAGPGVCRVSGQRRDRRYPGSALLAAACVKPFDNLFFVEQDGDYLSDLQQRIRRTGSTSHIHAWQGDVNQLIQDVSRTIPQRSLTVAFVDPFSLDIQFETIRSLARQRPLDLLVLFADSMDIVRNVEAYYYPNENSKLDHFLGLDSNWRGDWDALKNRSAGNVRELFANTYIRQLQALGYFSTRMLSIRTEHGPLYRLIYASKDPLGLRFWDIAASEDLGGERDLWSV